MGETGDAIKPAVYNEPRWDPTQIRTYLDKWRTGKYLSEPEEDRLVREMFVTGISDQELSILRSTFEGRGDISPDEKYVAPYVKQFEEYFIKQYGANISPDVIKKFCNLIDLKKIIVLNPNVYDKIITQTLQVVSKNSGKEAAGYHPLSTLIFVRGRDISVNEDDRRNSIQLALTEELLHRFLDLQDRDTRKPEDLQRRINYTILTSHIPYFKQPEEEVVHAMTLDVAENFMELVDIKKNLSDEYFDSAERGKTRIQDVGWQKILQGVFLREEELAIMYMQMILAKKIKR